MDPVESAISFHLLPIDDMGSAEDLYIKMNSRGKPLTDFEKLKAQIEKILDGSCPDFSTSIDGKWADVMWPLRGDDNVFDDDYLSYVRFVIDLCEWREGATAAPADGDVDRAQRLIGKAAAGAADNLDFLFGAFDAWIDEDTGEPVDTDAFFTRLLTTSPTLVEVDQGKVAMFGDAAGYLNLSKLAATWGSSAPGGRC